MRRIHLCLFFTKIKEMKVMELCWCGEYCFSLLFVSVFYESHVESYESKNNEFFTLGTPQK